MNRVRQIISASVAAWCVVTAAPASALVLTADYSDISVSGGIWQNAQGQLFSADPGMGATNVTNGFKANVDAAFTYLQNSILVNWVETVTFKLFDFAAAMINADGDSAIDSIDANNRPSASTIRLDSSSASQFFVDLTPFDNSEYLINVTNATLGGSSVNVGRYGSAVAGSAAENRTDVLTLVLHELVHSIGFNFLDRFDAAAGGAVGDPNRGITVPTSLTGFSSAFVLPILSASDHVDPFAQGGVFEHAITAEPSFGPNDRWLPTGAELYALCVVEGCAANEVNPNLIGRANTVPEPGSLALMAIALGLIPVMRRPRQALAK